MPRARLLSRQLYTVYSAVPGLQQSTNLHRASAQSLSASVRCTHTLGRAEFRTFPLLLHMPKALFFISPKTKDSSEQKIHTGESRFNALMKLHFATRSGRRTIKFYVVSALKVSSLQAWVWYARAALLLSCLQPPGGKEKTSFCTYFKQWDLLQGNSM